MKIIWITGGFHSGAPCGHFQKLIYPSAMPKGIDFAKILTQKSVVNTILIFGLHQKSQPIWGKALKPLLSWREEVPGRVFELYVRHQTLAALSRGFQQVFP